MLPRRDNTDISTLIAIGKPQQKSKSFILSATAMIVLSESRPRFYTTRIDRLPRARAAPCRTADVETAASRRARISITSSPPPSDYRRAPLYWTSRRHAHFNAAILDDARTKEYAEAGMKQRIFSSLIRPMGRDALLSVIVISASRFASAKLIECAIEILVRAKSTAKSTRTPT
jgi:hypothetical protein